MTPEQQLERLRDGERWAVEPVTLVEEPGSTRRRYVIQWVVPIVATLAIAALVITGVSTLRSHSEPASTPTAPVYPITTRAQYTQFGGLPNGLPESGSTNPGPPDTSNVAIWGANRASFIVVLYGGFVGCTSVPSAVTVTSENALTIDLTLPSSTRVCPAVIAPVSTEIRVPQGLDTSELVTVTLVDSAGNRSSTGIADPAPYTDCVAQNLSVALAEVHYFNFDVMQDITLTNNGPTDCTLGDLGAVDLRTADGAVVQMSESTVQIRGGGPAPGFVPPSPVTVVKNGGKAYVRLDLQAALTASCSSVSVTGATIHFRGSSGTLELPWPVSTCTGQSAKLEVSQVLSMTPTALEEIR